MDHGRIYMLNASNSSQNPLPERFNYGAAQQGGSAKHGVSVSALLPSSQAVRSIAWQWAAKEKNKEGARPSFTG